MWHHRPSHVFRPGQAYLITAATWQRRPLFRDRQRLEMLRDRLLSEAGALAWDVDAWVVFPSHYHLVATSPEPGADVRRLVRAVHSRTARELNALDGQAGRRVWFQYWDTCLTFPASYFARMSYVVNNPVKHGVASTPEDYPWSSAAAWVAADRRPFLNRVLSYRSDRVRVADDFPSADCTAGLAP